MTDRPILFSAPMVRALLAGTKTQERRLLKPQIGDIDRPFMMDDGSWHVTSSDGSNMSSIEVRYRVEDRLWVRETWQVPALCDVRYRATSVERIGHWDPENGPWRPSIFMPRWASRLTLIVESVKVERLQDISRSDAIAEGLTLASNQIEEFFRWQAPLDEGLWLSPIAAYRSLWETINGAGSWDKNPWVVVIDFSVHHCNIDRMAK